MRLNQWLAPVGLAVAAALVVVLAMRVRALNHENEELFRRLTRPYAGMYIPAFPAPLVDGGVTTVGSPARGRQILFVFTTTCPFCKTSIPTWSRIGSAAEAKYGRGAAVALSLDSAGVTRAYVQRNRLSYPVAGFPDERTQRLYRTRAVPVTMVIDSAGRVVYARVGELVEGAAADSVRAAAGLPRTRVGARAGTAAARALAVAQPQQRQRPAMY